MPTSSTSGRRIGLQQSEDYAASATAAKRSKNGVRSERVQDSLRPLDFEVAHSAGVRSANVGEALSNGTAQGHPRQSEHTPDEQRMVETPPAYNIPLYVDARLVTQSGRGLVLHFARPVADRRIVRSSNSSSTFMPRQSLQRRFGTRSSGRNPKSTSARQRTTS